MPLDLRPDEPVAFLCAVTGPGPEATLGALEELATKFGDVRARGPLYDFDMIDYYAAEMGPGLSKTLAWFGPLVAPAQLAARKQATISFERARADDGRRTVNVDPGLLSANSLVLATTKASGHRNLHRAGFVGGGDATLRKGCVSAAALDLPGLSA